jgi:hypothetical protein
VSYHTCIFKLADSDEQASTSMNISGLGIVDNNISCHISDDPFGEQLDVHPYWQLNDRQYHCSLCIASKHTLGHSVANVEDSMSADPGAQAGC